MLSTLKNISLKSIGKSIFSKTAGTIVGCTFVAGVGAGSVYINYKMTKDQTDSINEKLKLIDGRLTAIEKRPNY
ncbi:hypothetical protein RhiirA5_500446 [Rhizophagus irregularis]|uniref:Uncharacterized protein n=2 Tax=Rhizophagus irregularis TaxID=588596 RepID=U9U1S2_RHIID|nr:hypothetical protein GLOIN_2v1883813 [Rhizophagus irregularis DAOM 181602=DAOM 197198]PKC07756.1 hypothetical protein RhiirA5_500446 [Rhizophagus irregularis]PKC64040.1 hypothetical protein RhiirA1_422062 [Rhizophagus irregularis]PKK69072.1 hypothetical protein RhiirC2_850983 [Rhizophagus irregularis]PKY23049.1 hypothetical protein RhiirB3_411336 [Rhizophagus irregularis]PKY47265.1 hypothetical protein RhiirA4_403262 [Rhizophagus irregularis]|eukprot:XP_025167962.1 hypothetical protein GLOIN_2v1883813 [Rhizophagus irregularis DAOM 181602=DAOM 197198]